MLFLLSNLMSWWEWTLILVYITHVFVLFGLREFVWQFEYLVKSSCIRSTQVDQFAFT